MGCRNTTPVWPAERRKKREIIGTGLSAFSGGGGKRENSETNVVGRAPEECARPNGMSRPRGEAVVGEELIFPKSVGGGRFSVKSAQLS